MKMKTYGKNIEEVLKDYNLNKDTGLTSEQVLTLREQYGENKLKTKGRKSILSMIIKELTQFLNILLIIAAVISIIASGHITDGLFIVAIVILNISLAVFQERKAGNAVEALKSMSAPGAKVLRDGELDAIDSKDLVPGDIVIIEAGDYIPSDIRLIESINLKVDESALTGESEPVEVIRELAWLVDKNSRINFEIELLKEHYKKIEYDASESILKMDMKGKMKTQDLTFEFQIDLPIDYPMKVPSIKILNEFELEMHEKIKNDLQSSFKNFFDEWSPFSYLVDLFNAISKKIFEISVVSCVICHKIDCPTCSLKIAGPEQETCHVDCPYCERSYHKHCWEQTIKSFGKCGFCLKIPPPSMV